MIYKAVPADELEQIAMGLARQLAKGPTKTLGMAKMLLQKAWHMDAMQTFLYEQHLSGINLETEDSQEGARALRDKREPQFKGR